MIKTTPTTTTTNITKIVGDDHNNDDVISEVTASTTTKHVNETNKIDNNYRRESPSSQPPIKKKQLKKNDDNDDGDKLWESSIEVQSLTMGIAHLSNDSRSNSGAFSELSDGDSSISSNGDDDKRELSAKDKETFGLTSIKSNDKVEIQHYIISYHIIILIILSF